jgi:signal transduction histidine kinase/ActR/RegA family two-component response regulator
MAVPTSCDGYPGAFESASSVLNAEHVAEAQRLASLESLQILNTLPEDTYDRVVRRVSEFFGAPICLISIIGKDDLWFKAKIGVDLECMPREASFCQSALEQGDVFVVTNALQDPRFAHHPIVMGAPAIRFYAGIPLVIEGNQKIGTLCIADTKSRPFDAAASSALKDFGALVVDELHLRLRTIRLECELTKQKASEATNLASQHARADFLAMVAHEVRAPLNAIAGMVDLMCKSGQPIANGLGVDVLRDLTEQLVRMINEVLDLAKLEATGFTFNRQPFDLHREMRRALAVVRLQAAAKDLELNLQFDTSVPEWVVGDRTRVSQIMLNLLTNAIKFTPSGAVQVELSAQPGAHDRTIVTFKVCDSGIGMDADVARDLFRNFSQGTTEVRARYGGTGLGLAICQKLVSAMDGTVSVASEREIGTVFTFSIPFEIATKPAAPSTASFADGVCRAEQLILVADDDDISRKVCTAVLSRLGYRVEAYAGGRDALAALRTKPFDLAVLDLQMPDLDGYAVARELHQQPEFGLPVPLVALTGSAKPLDDPRLVLFDDYLVKPIDSATLDDSIMRILCQRERIAMPAVIGDGK